MKRAVQVTKVSRQLAVKAPNLNTLIDLPPADWFVRGPRGGLYLATGERERRVIETGDDWHQNTLSVIDQSSGLRYVLPRSKLAQQADV